MRQLPATSSSGATSTEHNRSRSSHNNETPGTTTLSNGIVKEPILTRSKSRLKVGRRLSGRSPKKLASPRKFIENEGALKKKPDKGTGNATNSTTSISSPLPSPKATGSSSEKMYARHYKSYRGLNGVTSRRGERTAPDNGHSNLATVKRQPTSENTSKDSRREKKLEEKPPTSLRKGRTVLTRNHVHQNGVGTPLSKPGMRNPSSRIRQLNLRRKKNDGPVSTPKKRAPESPDSSSPKPSPKEGEANAEVDADPAKDKAGKRRSALWVLNCEAEEFLFGETAAEKHEVELPPLAPPSPPPKKRRCRVNELGHLLEKSPILESKLRKSSSSECGSDMNRDSSPPRKRLKPNAQRPGRRIMNNKKHKEKTPEMCSSNSVKGCNNQPQSPKPELLSPIPFLYSPDSVDHEARTVQFQQMLTNVDWGYSFEEPPVSEPWYSAFTRTDTSIIPFESFVNPLHEPVVLPYEMDKTNRRSRSKPVRNSRKSPRCHASTLAIMSSERPTRSTRSSVNLDTSPSASVNNLPSESTLQALLLPPAPIPTPTTSTSTPMMTTRLSPPKYIPPSTRRRHPSSPRPSDSKNELGAAQYLWDSMQFLSDPYVVTLLSGEDPEVTTSEQPDNSKCKALARGNRCSNNNYVNCPVKNLVKNFESSSRKKSLRSGDGSGTSTNATVNSNCIANSRVTAVPKSSPRNQSHGTNHSGGHKVASPLVSPTATVTVNDNVHGMNGVTRRFTSRSPPISPPTRQTVCPSRLSPKNSKGTNSKQSKTIKGSGSEGDNGIISHDKSKKAIVLMADLFTASSGKTKRSNWEEDTLFIGDGLPPLPSWPV